MATFLELVNDVARESGTISQTQELDTVVGATGRLRRIVNWTRQAWDMIQRSRDDWTFQRQQFSATLTVGQNKYTASDLSISDFGRWLRPQEPIPLFSLYDPALGAADETRLVPVAYLDWLDTYDIGAHDAQRPGSFAIGFDHALNLGPKPDKAYTLRGWYRRGLQSLTADTDVPFISPDYHQAIVWRALMLLGDDDEAPFEVASSTSEFREIYSRLVHQYTDPVVLN